MRWKYEISLFFCNSLIYFFSVRADDKLPPRAERQKEIMMIISVKKRNSSAENIFLNYLNFTFHRIVILTQFCILFYSILFLSIQILIDIFIPSSFLNLILELIIFFNTTAYCYILGIAKKTKNS